MATTVTNVYFEEIRDYDKTRIFWTSKRVRLRIKTFKNGIAVAYPMCGSITSFADLIAGRFSEHSNFTSELFKAFECAEDTTFMGIQFNFNGVTLLITKENADADKIYAEWDAGMKANAEKYRLEREEYMKTPEYRETKQFKIATRINHVRAEVTAIDESTELEFKDDEAKAKWEQWVKINLKDGYSFGIVEYARRWSKYMQHLMKKHDKPLVMIADKASHVSDIDGITGFKYGEAVCILSQCWKHGKELSEWHNKKWGQEDTDDVVNPAVLTINVG